MNFLFWNLKQKPLAGSLATLAKSLNVDVIALTESRNLDFTNLLELLNAKKTQYFLEPNLFSSRFSIITRFPIRFVKPVFDGPRYLVRYIELVNQSPLIFVLVHMPDKRNTSKEGLALETTLLKNEIVKAEKKYKHFHTLLVGDFNMDPFETGVVGAAGLHAMMSKDVPTRYNGERIVNSNSFNFFYNPMWSFFGDLSNGPPGTHYYPKSEQVSYFWHMFDQVLIRPDLFDRFDFKSLKILDDDGENSLLTSDGRPNSRDFSDHLPIFFRINLEDSISG